MTIFVPSTPLRVIHTGTYRDVCCDPTADLTKDSEHLPTDTMGTIFSLKSAILLYMNISRAVVLVLLMLRSVS